MIRPIMRNQLFLAMPSEAATIEDVSVGQDLLDTLEAHAHECVGMAANIVFDDNGTAKLMFNPEIVHASSEYSTEEGCLSLVGQRPCRRYRKIRVSYQDESFKTCQKSFSGFTAQIIQHEIDHCNGIII